MAPWLLRYPTCPKSALQFSLIKLHLTSHQLASSYSRVTVPLVFCAQNIIFRPKVECGPPLRYRTPSGSGKYIGFGLRIETGAERTVDIFDITQQRQRYSTESR